MQEEIWKDVVGYEQYYMVSNTNKLRSKKTGRVLLPHVGKRKYWVINMHFTSRTDHKLKTMHRMMADAFIPNPENKPWVNHIDGNTFNNDLANMEWSTISENTEHAYDIGLHKMAPVEQYSLSGEFIRRWDAVTYTRELGINASNVISVCKGIRKSTGGYIWKYAV